MRTLLWVVVIALMHAFAARFPEYKVDEGAEFLAALLLISLFVCLVADLKSAFGV